MRRLPGQLDSHDDLCEEPPRSLGLHECLTRIERKLDEALRQRAGGCSVPTPANGLPASGWRSQGEAGPGLRLASLGGVVEGGRAHQPASVWQPGGCTTALRQAPHPMEDGVEVLESLSDMLAADAGERTSAHRLSADVPRRPATSPAGLARPRTSISTRLLGQAGFSTTKTPTPEASTDCEDYAEKSTRPDRAGCHASKSRMNIVHTVASDGMMRGVSRRLGLDKTWARLQKDLEDPEELPGWKQVHGSSFNVVSSLVITMNAIFMGWTASNTLAAAVNGASVPEGAHLAGEVLFASFFTVELAVRIFVERLLFICGPEWKWNLFDSGLVFLSCVDWTMMANGQESNANLTLTRMVRLLRFFRLARLTRVIRHIGNLRLVLYAILDSMSSLAGCFIIIGLTQYLFAVLFMAAVTEYLDEHGSQDTTSLLLREYFGGFVRSMITLFMVISGGIDWRDASTPLKEISSVYEIIFVFFVFLMQFGILNVVVGAFVAAATETAAKDKQALVQFELKEWETYTQRIRSFFQAADTDKSGTLSWEEFSAYLEDRKVKAWFQTMDLDVSQAHVLFELLDDDGSDQVTIDEFLEGCMRLKGQAKNIDMNMLIMMNKKLLEGIKVFTDQTNQRFSRLEHGVAALDEKLDEKIS